MGIFNFAHGEFVLLGAYTTYLVYARLPVGRACWPRHSSSRRAVRARALVTGASYARPLSQCSAPMRWGARDPREHTRSSRPIISRPSRSSVADHRRRAGLQWRLAIVIITAFVWSASYLLLTGHRSGCASARRLRTLLWRAASGISTNAI